MFTFLSSPVITILSILGFGFILALLASSTKTTAIRQICLIASLSALSVGLASALSFDKATIGFQFLSTFNLVPQYNVSLALGVDGLSFVFLLLTLITFPPLFLAAWTVSQSPKQFFCHLLGMEILLVLTFTTLDLFYFFILFESLLIPMFILIGVWGARNRKIKAAYYFFLYTLFGSLFMLFGMIYLYCLVGSLNYHTLLVYPLNAADQLLVSVCFFLAFAVKMPLFPVHIWLPEAHVEAPTAGSMLLASLLLKLGGYGFLRFSLTFLATATTVITPVVTALAIGGVIYGSLSTLRQVDLKRIIAYSSVSHMNLVVLGILAFNQEGLEGATYLMVAHGLVSSALFFCIGVIYDRAHSRLLRYYGGLVTVMPLFATGFLLFSLANMSFPGTPNFIGELLIFVGLFQKSVAVLFLSTAGIVLAAAFSVFLFNRVAFGTLKTKYAQEFTDIVRREYAVLLILAVPSLILGVWGGVVLEFCLFSIQNVILFGNTPVALSIVPVFFVFAGPSLVWRKLVQQSSSENKVNRPSWHNCRCRRADNDGGIGVLIAAAVVALCYGGYWAWQYYTRSETPAPKSAVEIEVPAPAPIKVPAATRVDDAIQAAAVADEAFGYSLIYFVTFLFFVAVVIKCSSYDFKQTKLASWIARYTKSKR